MSLGKLLKHSVPWFPYLSNEDTKSNYIVGLVPPPKNCCRDEGDSIGTILGNAITLINDSG